MKPLAACLLSLAVVASTGCKNPQSSSPTKPPPTAYASKPAGGADPDVAGAWEAAEKFARAWQTKNFDALKPMLSPELKESASERQLRENILGLPNHIHKAVEISSGRRSGDNRVDFTLDMTIILTGEHGDRLLKDTWRITFVRYNTLWLLDKVPMNPSDIPGG